MTNSQAYSIILPINHFYNPMTKEFQRVKMEIYQVQRKTILLHSIGVRPLVMGKKELLVWHLAKENKEDGKEIKIHVQDTM